MGSKNDLIMSATEMKEKYNEKWYNIDIENINNCLKDMLEYGYISTRCRIRTQSAIERLKAAGFRVSKSILEGYYDISMILVNDFDNENRSVDLTDKSFYIPSNSKATTALL